jgi:PGF-CTERM protein
MRQHAWTVAMVAVLVTSAFAGGIGVLAAPASADQHQASVTFEDTTSGGETIVVDEVTVPEGGFVTIHDNTLTEGNTLGSVVGTSAYLEPGTHEDVVVQLDDDVEDGTFHAMAHQDTNDDRAYTFVSSNGQEDGPYTIDGDIVMQNANVTVSASVDFSGQPSEGEYVTVDRVELSEPGFVTVHDSSLQDGAVFESVRGTSEYLEAGVYENLRIQLDDPLQNDDTLLPMAHRDTNDNQQYDFASSEGSADGPFLNANGDAVLDSGQAELADTANVSFSAQSSGGTVVVVDEAFVPEGGFVTVHDSSLQDGDTFESVRGTSEYLAPGLHRDIVVTLDDPLSDDDTLIPMAHQDTNGNEAYDFANSSGQEDGPYTDDGAVIDSANVTVSASVSMNLQDSDGTSVVVDRVDLASGGFVTIHDASLGAGAVLESVRGTSEYLEAGVHEDVVVELDQPLNETSQLIPMAHRDTNDNQAYDFLESEGSADGPFTFDGGAVVDTATVSVTASVFADAEGSDAGSVTIDRVTLHDGGFVTVHDSSLGEGAVLESVRGTSEYLSPGTHEDVEIALDDPLEEDDRLITMAHRDTNGNEAYDFVSSQGDADGPYATADGAVVDAFDLTVESMAEGDDSDMGDSDDGDMDDGSADDEMSDGDDEMDGGENESEDSDDGGPGFGIVAVVVAILGAGLLAARRMA